MSRFTLSVVIGKLTTKERRKLSTEELANIFGLNKHTIRQWQTDTGPTSAKIETIDQIVEACAQHGIKVAASDLLIITPKPKSPIDKYTNT